jgi:hypothetical protein
LGTNSSGAEPRTFVSSPGEGRGRFGETGIPACLYIAPICDSRRPSRFPMPLFASSDHHAARAACEFGRPSMGVLFSGVDRNRAPGDEDAYRAWLISRAQSPIVYHTGKMHLKRLRVLARRVRSRVSTALTMIHQAIVAAKLRRVQRELIFHAGSHDEWSRSKWREGRGSDQDVRDFPQRPLILGDKWDS